jgi:hypothetical protein
MTDRSTETFDTGAEAALAVAEVGLASRRAAKQAWLEAVASLAVPESASARGSRRGRAKRPLRAAPSQPS